MKVFAYGTLRVGQPNWERILRNRSTHLGADRIKGWDMFSLGYYPAVKVGSGYVTGSVFEVSDEVFAELDQLEGCPTFYCRSLVDTMYGEAWIYFMTPERLNWAKPIEGGDWVGHVEPCGWDRSKSFLSAR